MTEANPLPRWHFWVNLFGNQVVYLCAVAGAGEGLQWPALLTAGVYMASQILVSPHPHRDLYLIVLAMACAFGVDGTAAAAGAVLYAAAPWGWIPPPWILALWASFAMTLTASMAFLQRHWLLSIVFGLLLAPLAYVSASRGFAAVQFSAPAWHGLLMLGATWAAALSLLVRVARRAPQPQKQTWR